MTAENDKKKSNRGGKREGAGRKRLYDSPMTAIRIPTTLQDDVLQLREYKRHKIDYSIVPTSVLRAADELSRSAMPFFSAKVPAGFPSPADDDSANQLDLNEHFIASPSSTFFVRAIGDSMDRAGILDNSILQVDKSLVPRHNDIVVAAVEGEFTVKRYRNDDRGRVGLYPDSHNSIYTPMYLDEGRYISIWGVVSAIHHKLR